MGYAVLTTSATLTCPHGGQGSVPSPTQNAVMAQSPICTEDDQVVFAGCPFTVGPNPSPCVSVRWTTSSTACAAGGAAVLTVSSGGLCVNAANAPQGPVQLSPAQTSVTAV